MCRRENIKFVFSTYNQYTIENKYHPQVSDLCRCVDGAYYQKGTLLKQRFQNGCSMLDSLGYQVTKLNRMT